MIHSILYAADNGASIINISLTTFGAAQTSSYNSNYDEAVRYASIRGSLIVAASGNGDITEHRGQNLDIYPQSPVCNDGAIDGVLGVGALDILLRPAVFSNFGAKCVDLYAPGSQITTTDINGYAAYDGTSFATPIVSGVAALIRSEYPELKPREIISLLKKTSWKGVLDAKTAFDFFASNNKSNNQTASFASNK